MMQLAFDPDQDLAAVAPRLLLPAAELLLDALPPLKPNFRFLELVGSEGQLTRALLDRIGGLGRLVSVHEHAALVGRLPHKPGRNARVVGAAVHLPFANAAFDVVLVNLMLDGAPERVALAQELRRVLRPGGWMLATLLLKGSFDVLLDVLLECCETHGLAQHRQALLETRRAFPNESDVGGALGARPADAVHVGVEDRALMFADGASCLADPLVSRVLLSTWLRRLSPLPAAALATAARAIDTYFAASRFALRVRTAVVTCRLDRAR